MTQIYNEQYYRKHKSYADSPNTLALNEWRVKFMLHTVDLRIRPDAPRIIDYGCAHGDFLDAIPVAAKHCFAGAQVFGVDINPYCVADAVVRGHRVLSPEMFEYFGKAGPIYMMTFWDVLEHLPDPRGFLQRWSPRYFCASLPCLDGFKEAVPGGDIQFWKHYRPLEHLWNFTVKDFELFADLSGYEIVHRSFGESGFRVDPLLGAKNIMTFGCKRR